MFKCILRISQAALLLIVAACGDASSAAPAPAERDFLYVGTSGGGGSEGIYILELDRQTGEVRQVGVESSRGTAGFQAGHPKGTHLYSVSGYRLPDHPDQRTLTAYRIDPTTGALTIVSDQPVDGTTHVSVDPLGRFVFVSDYGGASVSIFPVAPDGGVLPASDKVSFEGHGPHPERQDAPYLHSAVPSPDGRFLYASAMGLDRIFVFSVDEDTGRLIPGESPFVQATSGTGPRHFAVHPSGRFAYSVEEILFSLAAYSVDPRTGGLRPLQRLSLPPEDIDPSLYISGADVHVSPDGRSLYATLRGHDSIVNYRVDPTTGMLTRVDYAFTGRHSRAFGMDRKGEFVFVANRDSDSVFVYRRDPESGSLEKVSEVSIPSPTCVTHVVVTAG